MIRLRMRASRRPDEGFAMIFVIAIGMVVALLAAAMFASVLQNQSTTRVHRNVTSAQGAAEAVLDEAVYQLGLVSGGNSNWTTWQSTYTSQASSYPLDLSGGATANAWVVKQTTSGGALTGNLIVYAKGTFGGNTRTIRAVVTQGAPPAFDYSMFASKGIDIHQHGGWLSPQVWTTSVHSNGYIAIDYPSEFNANSVEAVGNLTLEKGGGKIPSGTVTSSGYSWPDPLNGLCYPGGYNSPGGTPAVGGSCPFLYPGNAVINGSVYAGSLTLGSHGIIKNATPVQLDTNKTIDGGTNNGGAWVGSTNVNCATSCNKANPTGGQVQGTVTVKGSGYAPDVVPFPSIDYSTKIRPYASTTANASSPSGSNYFTSPAQFLSYLTGTTSLLYNADTSGNLTRWDTDATSRAHFPDVILLSNPASTDPKNRVWDVNGGSLSLDFGTIWKNVQAATGLSGGAAPIILVQGDLVVEGGGITLSSGLVVVGADNRTNGIVIPYNPTTKTPAHINTAPATGLLDPNATQSGVLAAGGQISSNDYDTDSPWTSTSTYEPLKAAPVYVRGLVYSASWSSSTGSSTPQNQHWHNFDPKNLMKVYGAQVGADLHDCNNFSFTYDPIVRAALGFGGGSVKVLDYQELGN